MVAITTGILGALLYGTASSALGSVADARHGARVGPRGGARRARRRRALGHAGRARSSSPRPTSAFLLGAPLRAQRRWRCGRLARGAGVGAGAAAVVGGVAAGRPRGRRARRRRRRARSGSWPASRCSALLGVARRGARPVLGALGAGDRLALPASLAVGAGLVALADAATPGAGSCCGRGRGAGRCSPSSGTAAASLLALALLAAVTAARRRGRRARLRALPDRAPRRARRGAQRRRGVGVGTRRAHCPPVAAARRGTARRRRRHARLRAPRHPELADPVARRDVGAARAPAHARQRRAGGRRGGGRHRGRRPPAAAAVAALGSYVGREHAARAAARARSIGRAPRGCSCAVRSAASCSATSPCRSP